MAFSRQITTADPSRLFKTLSDPTRLRLLNLLIPGEVCVCHLVDTLGAVQPKVSRHLAELKRAGLVTSHRDGKWIHYRWKIQRDPLTRHVLAGLRDAMTNDSQFAQERSRLRKICCVDKRTETGRKIG